MQAKTITLAVKFIVLETITVQIIETSQNQEIFTRVTESQNNDMIVAVMAIAMALQPQNQGAPDGIELD